MADLIRWLLAALRRRWRPGRTPSAAVDLDAHDRRLDAIEADQREIAARLHLLEYQANLRGRR